MKRLLSILLIALLSFQLAGCSSGGGGDPAPSPEATLEVVIDLITPDPTPTPTATPEPTPLPGADEISFTDVSNATLSLMFTVPDHWVTNPARRTVQYEEPTGEGVTPARVAITYKTLTKKPDTKAITAQRNKFVELLKEEYDEITLGESSANIKVMNVKGYRTRYTAKIGDEAITGYILFCYIDSGRRLYLIHFSAPAERYIALDSVWDKVLASIQRPK